MGRGRQSWALPACRVACKHVQLTVGSTSPPLNPRPACSIRGEAEKRLLLLQQLDKAGQQQLMRGRVRCGRGAS